MALPDLLSGRPGALPRSEIKSAASRANRVGQPNGNWNPEEVEARRRRRAMRIPGGGSRDVPKHPSSASGR